MIVLFRPKINVGRATSTRVSFPRKRDKIHPRRAKEMVEKHA